MGLDRAVNLDEQAKDVVGGEGINHRTLSALVMEKIGNWIIDGTLAKGERIIIKKVAQEIGVSEMPVREALKILETQGLVKSIPYRGTWVKELSARSIKELYMLRELLEGKAAELAVEKITDTYIEYLEDLNEEVKQTVYANECMKYTLANQEFHLAFYGVSECEHLCSYIKSIWESLAYYRLVYSAPFMINHAIEEHHQYLEACRRRDSKLAGKLVRENLREHASYLISKLD